LVLFFFSSHRLFKLIPTRITSYDYYQYKFSYELLQANEVDETHGIIDKAQESAMERGSPIAERIVMSGANRAKIQGILSSAKAPYLATDPGCGVYDPSKVGQTHKQG
jgi:hypothetical protein